MVDIEVYYRILKKMANECRLPFEAFISGSDLIMIEMDTYEALVINLAGIIRKYKAYGRDTLKFFTPDKLLGEVYAKDDYLTILEKMGKSDFIEFGISREDFDDFFEQNETNGFNINFEIFS